MPDIVHAHSVYPAITIAASASRKWAVPYCLTEHRPSSTNRNVRVGRGKHIYKEVRAAGARATVSQPFADVLAEYYRTAPWQVIALPVPQEAFYAPMQSGEGFTLLHVSHLGENKRPKLLLSAFAKAREQLPELRLRIGGKGQPGEIDQLQDYARTLGVDAAVEFLGAVERDQVFALMGSADAFVLASAVEAGGTVLAEVQACGLPCIATRTWAGKFMVPPEAGITVPIDNAEALAHAVVQVAEAGRFDRQQIRSHAHERFSEAAFTRANLALYKEALG